MRVGGNGVEIGRMEPVLAAPRSIFLLAGFLLPEHRLFRPFIDPVAAAIADHRVVEFAVCALRLAHDDTRLHIQDFTRINTAPDPHQAVNHAIPVGDVFAV